MDGFRPTAWDWAGATVSLLGAGIIITGSLVQGTATIAQ